MPMAHYFSARTSSTCKKIVYYMIMGELILVSLCHIFKKVCIKNNCIIIKIYIHKTDNLISIGTGGLEIQSPLNVFCVEVDSNFV